jgi:hypothetical protein
MPNIPSFFCPFFGVGVVLFSVHFWPTARNSECTFFASPTVVTCLGLQLQLGDVRMRSTRWWSLMLLALAVSASGWVGGYYRSTSAAAYPPSLVEWSSLTQIHVFAASPLVSGGGLDTSFHGMNIGSLGNALSAFRVPNSHGAVALAHAAGVEALMTVGGAGTGALFTTATHANNLPTFVSNIVAAVNEYRFDGVDIDWESPSSSSDYIAWLTLVANLRTAKPGMLITAAVGRGNANIGLDNATFYAALANSCDQVNQRTYGLGGNHPGILLSSPSLRHLRDQPTRLDIVVFRSNLRY